jgi:hypothetical protein
MHLTATIRTALVTLVAAVVAGCATVGDPSLRTDYDENVDFGAYETFGWAPELGTDRGGYSTMTTNYFKDAVRDEMEALGYRYAENDPDLLVNFYTSIRDRISTYTTPQPIATLGTGYYGYRYGLYTAWPYYAREVNTVHYQIGTANVDVVDAERRQLIWEGIAEGRLTEERLENPAEAIDEVVEDLFRQFPTRNPQD